MFKTYIYDNILRIKNNNSFQTLFLRLIGIVFIFLTTYVLTNNFDSRTVGLYDFTRSYLLIFGSICMLSSDQTILYLIGRYNNNKKSIIDIYKKILFFCFILCLINISIFYMISLFDVFHISSITKEIILKSNFILFFYSILLINTEIFRALNYTVYSELFRNVFKYTPLIIGFCLISYFNNPIVIIDFFIYGFFFVAVFSSIALYWMIKKTKEAEIEGYKRDTYKDIIKYSIPITISTVSIYLLSSIDIFFLKYFFGDNYVAYYSVSFKLIAIINVSINAISLSVATDIAYNYANKNIEKLKYILNRTAKIIFIFSILFSLIIFLFSSKILLIFGEEYIISKTALIILLVGNLLMSFAGNTYIYLLMTNKGVVLGRLIFAAVLINVLLNFFIIPIYGIEGAAFTSIISILFWNFIGAFYIFKVDRINITLIKF